MSVASILDDRIYEGRWEISYLFTFFGILAPILHSKPLKLKNLKAGTTWTKFNNQCMRASRIKTMATRCGRPIDHDVLHVLVEHAKQGNYEPLRDYKIAPTDVDVINHLIPMKRSLVQTIKRNLADQKI